MRLSTINENIAQRFRRASDTNDARRIFEEIFRACARRIENRWYVMLENDQLALQLAAGELPRAFDFVALSGEMDEKYFDAEDDGRDADAVAYFALARLMSALSFAVAASDIAAFSEATYEAIMALPNPKEDSAALVKIAEIVRDL
ncbi:hypothetical protein G6L00_09490 [Agrobacterium rhizogenes]|nr:hypothetical protein [Rhizobium rhizogenes]NTH38160.1 hypothetical protein [Rhizobium rhizogenes]NTJ00590.1 hypothetical protein [Rhizobium rhizogenes]